MDGLTCTCIGSRFAYRSIQEGVGGVLADSRIEGDVVGGVDGEVEGDDGVATIDGVSMENIVSGYSSHQECSVTPNVWKFVLADGLILTQVVRWINVDGERPS